MYTFAVLFVCVCLVQSTFGQCVAGSRAVVADNGGSAGGCGAESYGGAGEGKVGVAGVLPVSGTATVGGRVPIVGAVRFSGPVAAHGQVTITGQCTCGCGCACGPR